ncbi:hypothetical protein CDAR_6841 [Caerostris darwini]|uniref:Uncharacterized protein n=1 Tax=Caerostris darwini TaxID=1538125 RepID=A0AAV4V3K1_9ARAC|nr:hypothetical protein CDAR_6841 [Caerostris darwini]
MVVLNLVSRLHLSLRAGYFISCLRIRTTVELKFSSKAQARILQADLYKTFEENKVYVLPNCWHIVIPNTKIGRPQLKSISSHNPLQELSAALYTETSIILVAWKSLKGEIESKKNYCSQEGLN